MICRRCYFDLIYRIQSDLLVHSQAEYDDDSLTCIHEDDTIFEETVTQFSENIGRTKTWNGIEVK